MQYGHHHERINANFTTFPTVRSRASSTSAPTSSYNPVTNHVVALNDNFTWTMSGTKTGDHVFKTGAQIKILRSDSFFDSNFRGTYAFPNLAAFLAGTPSTFTQNQGDSRLKRPNETYGFFVQDDWRPIAGPDAESRPALRLREREDAGADRRDRRAGAGRQRRQEQRVAALRLRVVAEERHAPGDLRRHRPLLRSGDSQHHRQRALHAAEGDWRPHRQSRVARSVPGRHHRDSAADGVDHRSGSGDAAQLELAGRLPPRADGRPRPRRQLRLQPRLRPRRHHQHQPWRRRHGVVDGRESGAARSEFHDEELLYELRRDRISRAAGGVEEAVQPQLPGRRHLCALEDGEQLVQLRERIAGAVAAGLERGSGRSGPAASHRRSRVDRAAVRRAAWRDRRLPHGSAAQRRGERPRSERRRLGRRLAERIAVRAAHRRGRLSGLRLFAQQRARAVDGRSEPPAHRSSGWRRSRST